MIMSDVADLTLESRYKQITLDKQIEEAQNTLNELLKLKEENSHG